MSSAASGGASGVGGASGGAAPHGFAPAASVLYNDDDGVVRNWDEFEVLDTLGEGAFGIVLRIRRKRGSRMEFACKQPKRAQFGFGEVETKRLTELREEFAALRKLNTAWMPACALDTEWCPIVKVYGLFLTPQVGLIMECHGISLLEAKQLPPDAGLDDCARVTVARHVASALRFLHERGIAHRDLKSQNVLVDPAQGFRAKVTDFGTSHLVTALHVEHVVERGTTYAMAPELLLAQGRGPAAGATLDFRKCDVYAFAVLLCELWARRMPFLAMPRRDDDDEIASMLEAVCENNWRPATPLAMPGDYAELMQNCWAADPGTRLSFEEICDVLFKLQAPAPLARSGSAMSSGSSGSRLSSGAGSVASLSVVAAAAAAPRAQLRARLALRHQPTLVRGEPLELLLDYFVEDHAAAAAADAAAAEALVAADGQFDADGRMCLEFVFHVAEGDTCKLHVTPVEGSPAWLLGGTAELQPGGHVTMCLEARWDDATPDDTRAALRCAVERAPAGAAGTRRANMLSSRRILGALSLLLAPAAPRRCLKRLPSKLCAEHNDIMISYRDAETGMAGPSKFAFILQAELEAAGFSVFCYATLFSDGNRFINVLTHGIQSCRAFIPVISPTYGDLDISPWTHNELVQADRHRRASPTGTPAIVPVWHHGAYLMPDTAAVLAPLRRVPAGPLPAAEMPLEALMAELLEALRLAGVTSQTATSRSG